MSSEFQPLIRNKSSLQEKKVVIQGSDNFSRGSTNENDSIQNNSTNFDKEISHSISENVKEDKRLRATTTQKTSASTNLKISTLKPFLKEVEGLNKATFNDIVSLLVDNYAQTKFTTRQLEAYKSMFKMQFDMLEK